MSQAVPTSEQSTASSSSSSRKPPLVVVGTWPFSAQACEQAGARLQAGEDIMQALVMGVSNAERDPAIGPYFVGLGGMPNADGCMELDAAVMRGKDCAVGAVAGLQG